MDEISKSRGWDKEIPHGVLPMEQPVLSDKRARILFLAHRIRISDISSWDRKSYLTQWLWYLTQAVSRSLHSGCIGTRASLSSSS